MKLKASMIGKNGSGLNDWVDSGSDTAHCYFYGVVCDQEYRVVSLNVSFVPLFGEIPPEIGRLDKLVNLTLAADNLTGEIPVEIGNLTALVVFNISNNVNIGGNFPGEIFDSMTRLEVVDVYNNNFTGPLPVQLANLGWGPAGVR